MGVQLNIKDTETVCLARELAERLGGSVTAAIKVALQEKIDAVERAAAKPSIDEAMELVRGLKLRWKPEFDGQELSVTHGDLLYDVLGLPK